MDERHLQQRMIALIRAFGLHQPDRTPCGQPVTVSEAHALMELAAAASLSQKELATRLQLEKSTVSRLVDGLERRGWVQRERDTEDGRVTRVSLTPAGCRANEQIAAARAATFARVLREIPEHERAAVMSALDVLVQAMHAVGEEGLI